MDRYDAQGEMYNKEKGAVLGGQWYPANETDKKIQKLEENLKSISDINDFDCGLINDYGGGNVQWWQDYIRSVISQCNEHWREALKYLEE